MEKILISACLIGREVRYDGQASTVEDGWIARWQRQGRLVAVCPEVAGGLSVPRPAAEIEGGDGTAVLEGQARLKTENGDDVTDAFIAGARHALAVARREEIRLAILKARSPSCGSSQIYDGSFTGQKRRGSGVTAALLRRVGITVFHEGEIDKVLSILGKLEGRPR